MNQSAGAVQHSRRYSSDSKVWDLEVWYLKVWYLKVWDLQVWYLQVWYLEVWYLQVWDLEVWDLEVWDLEAWYLEVWDLEVWYLQVWDLKVWDLQVWDLKVWYLQVWDLKVWDLKVWDLKVWYLKVWDLKVWYLKVWDLKVWDQEVWYLQVWYLKVWYLQVWDLQAWYQEDIGPIGPDRNWKGIGISLLVILVVLSLIGLSIVLLSKDNAGKPSGSPLTLDDLFDRNFQVHDPGAKWINDEEVIFRSFDGDILKVNTRNQTELLMKNTTFATFKASKFAVSPDLNFVLLAYDIKQVYQHSFLASYLIYNLYTREVKELNPPEVSDSVLQFASWGGHGQQMIYIFENNIYFQSDVQSSSWRLTSSGQEGIIFNGIADWLYEEEILHTHVAHWWSADGSRLAYLTINDSLVPNMLLPRFTGMLYPRGKEYPYPKMAQINPTVRLYVVTLDGTSQTTELRPPDSFEKSEYYITMVKWVGPESLSVRWVNRAQNMSILSLCSVVTGICTSKKVMTSEKWLDRQNEEPLYSRDHMTFFITVPLKHSDSGTFSHITMFLICSSQSDGREGNIRHLTSGSWEVSQLLAYDESINSVDSALGGQAVSDRFSLGWDTVLVSLHSVIVARLDGRGSGFQGQRILHEVHQRLGTVDVKDQLAALQYLLQLPYVDHNRIGVYGKAYGGFVSSLLLLSHSSMFRCGIAVAPITNWKLYGSAQSEKYFGYPGKEDHKYQISTLLHNIAQSPLNFLIIHNTADDEGHNIASSNSQLFMLNSVLSFFRRCFEDVQIESPETAKEDD
eukprot:XP_011611972.1 PREDICTED: inactive dipeptidyl peptidase 10-like [Takifugu rubripes]